jgi:(R,R)-butanediol dehydrogenase / meso-butanediol dehydrogenase / diacetyl reductase
LALLERNAGRAGLIAQLAGARILAAEASDIAEFTGGAGLRYAIEAAGSPLLLRFLLGTLAGGGRLVMVGLFTGDQTVSANAVVERELEVRGCSVFCQEQREALALLPELAEIIERVIAPTETLERLPQVYERLIAGQSPYLKTIVEP